MNFLLACIKYEISLK